SSASTPRPTATSSPSCPGFPEERRDSAFAPEHEDREPRDADAAEDGADDVEGGVDRAVLPGRTVERRHVAREVARRDEAQAQEQEAARDQRAAEVPAATRASHGDSLPRARRPRADREGHHLGQARTM